MPLQDGVQADKEVMCISQVAQISFNCLILHVSFKAVCSQLSNNSTDGTDNPVNSSKLSVLNLPSTSVQSLFSELSLELKAFFL